VRERWRIIHSLCNKNEGRASSERMCVKQVRRCCRPGPALQSVLVRNLCVILMLIAALLPSRAFSLSENAAQHTAKGQDEVGCQHCACGGGSTCCLKPAAPDSDSNVPTPPRVQHFDSLATLACSGIMVSRTDVSLGSAGSGYADSGKRRQIPLYLRNCTFLI
jgi:hypothetical protein